jgi:hypothetical protein
MSPWHPVGKAYLQNPERSSGNALGKSHFLLEDTGIYDNTPQ